MNVQLIWNSIQAFHANAVNSLLYAFSNNWCLILLVIAALTSVIMGVREENAAVVREEQNIL